MMQPGENIKPQVTEETVLGIMEKVYGLQVGDITELNAYDDKNFRITAYHSTSPFIRKLWPEGYVLKILNTIDSQNIPLVDAQSKVLLHLNSLNVTVPVPVKNVYGKLFSLETVEAKDGTRKSHIVRLLEYRPGSIFKSAPLKHRLFREAGIWLGKLDNALKDFSHAVFDNHATIWHLKSAPLLKSYFYVVDNPVHRSVVSDVVESFIQNVLPKLDHLEKGIIHGDFNEQNILVQLSENGECNISAILDFGDINKSCYLFEIGAALCYMMLEGRRVNLDPIECGKETLKGYQSIRRLSTLEYSLLRITICTRLCQSLVLGLYTQSIQPDNAYVGDTQKNGWALLFDLWKLSDDQLLAAWNVK